MTRKAEFLTRGERDSSTFNNTFQTLGAALTSPGVIVKITNASTIDIDISLDAGVTEHDFVPADGFILYDLRANHGRIEDFVFSTGTQVTIRGAIAGTGNVYLTVIAEVD